MPAWAVVTLHVRTQHEQVGDDTTVAALHLLYGSCTAARLPSRAFKHEVIDELIPQPAEARRVWARMVYLEALEQRRQQARTGHTPHVLEQLAQIEARHLAIWGDAASGGGAEAAAPYPSSAADWREVARELRPPPGVALPTRDALDVEGHSGGGGGGGRGGGGGGDIGGGASAGLASLASALGGVMAEERGGAPSPL